MKKYILFILTFIPVILFAQEIHSTAEILQIMTDSKITYNIEALSNETPCPDRSSNINIHYSYRIETDSGINVFPIEINDLAKKNFDIAESFFQKGKYDSALVYYKLTLFEDPKSYNAYTYIGQIYGIKNDYKNAIDWYNKAIQKNYIDYMAHWFIADIYLETGDFKKALDEILIAKILNRNNPRIQKALEEILTKNKLNTIDWCFNPQYELIQESNNKVTIKASALWLGYAFAKAVWEYEPGYSESMGVAKNGYSTLEDKEALIALLVLLEKEKKNIKKEKQFVVLNDALENKYIDAYIVFEILLPDNPEAAYQLDKDIISHLKEYLINIRYK